MKLYIPYIINRFIYCKQIYTGITHFISRVFDSITRFDAAAFVRYVRALCSCVCHLAAPIRTDLALCGNIKYTHPVPLLTSNAAVRRKNTVDRYIL